MSLRDRIKAEASNTGFQAHPIGEFDGTIVEVKAKTTDNGDDLFEFHVKTNVGRAKMTLWKKTLAGIEIDAQVVGEAEAQERYIKGIARYLRLYRDLGLEEPAGESDEEFEAEVYNRIGEATGKDCHLVVKAGQQGKENTVYINAPKHATKTVASPKAAAKPVAAVAKPSMPKPLATQRASSPANDDIPF